MTIPRNALIQKKKLEKHLPMLEWQADCLKSIFQLSLTILIYHFDSSSTYPHNLIVEFSSSSEMIKKGAKTAFLGFPTNQGSPYGSHLLLGDFTQKLLYSFNCSEGKPTRSLGVFYLQKSEILYKMANKFGSLNIGKYGSFIWKNEKHPKNI